MENRTQVISYQVFDSIAELSEQDARLFRQAAEVTATSYAPYSRYHVGAAVRLANGMVFTGSNQENISFPAGLCAERVAVFAAMSAFPDVPVEAISITAKADLFEVQDPVPPCGMCRQAILEYEIKFNNSIRIILGGSSGKIFIVEGMHTLLPLAFNEKGLVR